MKLQNKQPKYRFYATLLDSFNYYLNSESETAFQEFIDKLNRVPFTSEAAEKGTAFNALVDHTLKNKGVLSGEKTEFNGFEFSNKVVEEFVSNLQGAISQVRTSAFIETTGGLVEVYGDIDEVMPACLQVDIKTTGSWEFPKFLHNWQQIVYPYCFYVNYDLIYNFSYMVTDFRNVTTETYLFNPARDIPKLKNHCEALIEFIEANRVLITDKKLFGLHETETSEA